MSEKIYNGLHYALMGFLAVFVLTFIGWVAGLVVFQPSVNLQTVHAQSGTTCCKIDPVIISVDDQGNLVVYHAKGPLTLPAGSTTVYTGTSLSQALTISEDTLYAVKGSQQ